MRDIAMLLLFCPMLVISVRYVHLGTMLWAWTALAGPTTYLYGVAADFPFNKAAAVATVIGLVADRTKRKFYVDGFFIFFTLFLLQGVISFTFGLADIPRTYDLLDKMVKIWVLCIIMKMASRDRLQIYAMVIVFTFSLGLHGALEGMKYVLSAGAHKVVASAVIGDNNYLALAVLMILPFVIYLYRVVANRAFKAVLIAGGLASFVGVVATASRGGLIGLAALALMIFLQSKRKVLTIFAIVTVAVGLVAFAPSRWVDRMETMQTVEQDDSFMSRVASWKMNTILALDRPFLGGGYSALEDGRVHRAYLPMFGMLDFIPTEAPAHLLAAHSIYFAVLGDLGFIGFILFICMLVSTYLNIRKVKSIARGTPEHVWAYELGTAFHRSLVIFMIVGAALSASYFEILYIQITLVSILRRSLEESAARRTVAAGTAVALARGSWAPAPSTNARPWVR